MQTPDFIPTDVNPELQLIISQTDQGLYFCPSRKVSRIYLMGIVLDVLNILGGGSSQHVDPADCRLNYALSIIPWDKNWNDDEDDDEEDEDDEGGEAVNLRPVL